MGALHAGHRALLARARTDNRFVVASVFVNPLQFGPAEDLASYPRDREADLAMLAAEGADLAFLPAEGEVWPVPPEVRLRVGALAERLEGLVRPGHLDGVATVVAKLLHLVGPSRAYFGQKDAQQLAVVRRMVDDLAFPNEIVACPTVREPDGLAVSSRNAYLSAPERRRATALYRALRAGRDAFLAGRRDPAPSRRPPATCWTTSTASSPTTWPWSTRPPSTRPSRPSPARSWPPPPGSAAPA
jgi:pantoate--beta-alanine ligase